MNTKQLAKKLIGHVKQNPAQATFLFRKSGAICGYLASLPENAHVAPQLEALGFEFIDAAMNARFGAPTEFAAALLNNLSEAPLELGSIASPSPMQQYVPPPQDSRSGRMSISPASFNETTTLGRIANIQFNPSADQRISGIAETQTVAFWQGNKIEAQAMSVDVGTSLPPAPQPGASAVGAQDARAFALIEWGIDGYRASQVKIDVGLGRRLSIPANYIAVTVGMDPPGVDSTGAPMVPALLTVGAGIAAFPAISTAPVIRTVYIDNITGGPGGVVVGIPIPARAVLMLPPLTGTTNTVDVLFFNYNGVFITQWTWANPANVPAISAQPIPPDAFFISVQSAQSGNLRIPFQLSL